jgi:hypothetical protein
MLIIVEGYDELKINKVIKVLSDLESKEKEVLYWKDIPKTEKALENLMDCCIVVNIGAKVVDKRTPNTFEKKMFTWLLASSRPRDCVIYVPNVVDAEEDYMDKRVRRSARFLVQVLPDGKLRAKDFHTDSHWRSLHLLGYPNEKGVTLAKGVRDGQNRRRQTKGHQGTSRKAQARL